MDDKVCKFCCKIPAALTTRLATGTVPPVNPTIERHVRVFREYPPHNHHIMPDVDGTPPTILRDNVTYLVCRWTCSHSTKIGCNCCRPANTLLPWELTEAEEADMASGLMIVVNAK